MLSMDAKLKNGMLLVENASTLQNKEDNGRGVRCPDDITTARAPWRHMMHRADATNVQSHRLFIIK